jgi:ribonuclease BN (tRNA processing enzyme)
MPSLRLVCLGCGDAFSARWYSTCFALESEETWLLVDCPHPIRKILHEAASPLGLALDVDSFSAVLLTHLHADHASGIEGWSYYSKFVLNRRPVLLAHPEVTGAMWEHSLSGSMAPAYPDSNEPQSAATLDDFFDVRALSEESTVTHGPFQIECRRTCHPIPTFALRIKAGGKMLGYSCDTSFDPGLIEWLSHADVMIHETNRGIHTPYEALVGLPVSLRERMRLVHYPDDFDLNRSVIPVLKQGDILQL